LSFVCNVEKFETVPRAEEAVPATDLISAERKLTEVCVFACPLAELVAPPTMRHHAETSSTMIAGFGAASSYPRTTIRGDCVEVAASRTEEGDGDFLSNDCSGGKSIRQREKVSTPCCCTADHSQWVETHLRQVLLSVGGYHDALA
jgi:hypothetical protein